jgi:hypothetical protein
MTDHYAQLTDAEKAHWDEYTRLRELSDWPGFTDGQDQRRAAARSWLVEQRKFIWRCAEGKETPEYPAGWDRNQRSERYAQLKDESLNSGACRRVASLPREGATDSERALLAERCTWWQVSSTSDVQKARKQSCTDWLISRRKQVYGLIQDGPESENDANYRSQRYANLCIATKYGDAYVAWAEDHDPYTGEAKSAGGGARARAVENCRKYLGVNEDPPNSNRGEHIDDWCRRVYGGTGVPWCACFATCMAWDAGAVGSSSAAVQYCIELAKQHSGIYRGWTTDPDDVLRGDLAVISCSTCHIGMVVDSDDAYHTIEGNTSPGSEGSQYDGGCVAERHREGAVVGWCLVDYPD